MVSLYLTAHWCLEIASGGDAYYFYRYPLETLVASGPLLFLAYQHRIQPSARRRRWFWMLVGVAAAAHAVVSLG